MELSYEAHGWNLQLYGWMRLLMSFLLLLLVMQLQHLVHGRSRPLHMLLSWVGAHTA